MAKEKKTKKMQVVDVSHNDNQPQDQLSNYANTFGLMLALIAFPVWLIWDFFSKNEWFLYQKWLDTPLKERLIVVISSVIVFQVYRYFFIGY